jgi:phage terminase large subunit-like protein
LTRSSLRKSTTFEHLGLTRTTPKSSCTLGSRKRSVGIEKVIQGAKTESVPLGELKILAQERMLIFDQELMSFTMGNAITIEDTNGNRKLLKRRQDEKIDNVAALMDAWVAYKVHKEAFE